VKGIAELLDEFEASRNVDRDPRVGPSDYGSCPRQIMYRVRGHELGEQRTSSRAATMGTLFWQGLGGWIAEQYPDAIVEEHVDVPGLERGGSVDLRWIVDGVIVDVKTVSERAFDRVLTVGAKPENVGQLETYALAVNRAALTAKSRVDTLTLAYVNRDTGAVEEISWAYDETTAREKLSELVHIEQMIDDGHELPRAEGARLGAFPCTKTRCPTTTPRSSSWTTTRRSRLRSNAISTRARPRARRKRSRPRRATSSSASRTQRTATNSRGRAGARRTSTRSTSTSS
jgi:hypothetical protein